MKDFTILKLLDKIKPLFIKLGIDYEIMRKILQVKFLMDGRRVPTVFTNNKNNAEDDNKFIKSLGVYFLMGLILIPFVWMRNNYIYQMSIVSVIIMFFIMTSLISDFSSVLLDIKDINIIGTRPVDPKTLRFAKTIHISVYMFYITSALTGPALLVSLYRQGILFFIIFIFTAVLLDLFSIVLTSLVYFIVLRFFDGEKLKDIINYIQIILSFAIIIGYQLVGRLFNFVDLDVHFVPKWWQYLIIPVWFSAPFQMLKKSEINNTYLILTTMAIVIPLLAIAFYIKLMPHFENNLHKLSNNSGKNKRVKRKPVQLLAKIICRNKEEQVFFRFAADMMKNEREFKLKVYPTLGFSTLFPFVFLFQQIAATNLKEVSLGKTYFFIYFSGMLLPTVMYMIRYSTTYKGAWIYKILPIDNTIAVFRGTTKAFVAKLFFPLYLLEAIVFTAVYGVVIIPSLLTIFINMMIYIVLCFMANEKSLPFSEGFESTHQVNGMTNLLLFIVLAIMAGIHYLFTTRSYGVYIYFILAFIINLELWKMAFHISPDKLNKN